MELMGLTRALAEAMGMARKHVNKLCNDRRTVTAPTAPHPRPPPATVDFGWSCSGAPIWERCIASERKRIARVWPRKMSRDRALLARPHHAPAPQPKNVA
jgi:hypothetical protein